MHAKLFVLMSNGRRALNLKAHLEPQETET